uniref:hypothetical protein n=1 Tax=Serratia entomophila TaxID=42906 RepID=UPI001F4C3A55|nr:hypothetical protein [Serratia entomophila]
MSGKRYPEEFKIEAVKQVVDRGYLLIFIYSKLMNKAIKKNKKLTAWGIFI